MPHSGETPDGALVPYVVLRALHAGGVDSWEWYGSSLEGLEDD